MATINNKLIHFKSKSDFNSRYKETTDGGNTYGDFLGTSIVFIQDAKQIWTHGQFYDANEATLASLGITATAAELNKLDGVTATTQELNYMDGVTSNVQTQLNNKTNIGHTHTISQITDIEDLSPVYIIDYINLLNHETTGSMTSVQFNEVKQAIEEKKSIAIYSTDNTSSILLVMTSSSILDETNIQLLADVQGVKQIFTLTPTLWNYSYEQTISDLSDLGITATAAELNQLDGVTLSNYALKSDIPDISTLATKSELSSYLPLSGGTLTGSLFFKDNTAGILLVTGMGLGIKSTNNGSDSLSLMGGGITLTLNAETSKSTINGSQILTEDNYSNHIAPSSIGALTPTNLENYHNCLVYDSGNNEITDLKNELPCYIKIVQGATDQVSSEYAWGLTFSQDGEAGIFLDTSTGEGYLAYVPDNHYSKIITEDNINYYVSSTDTKNTTGTSNSTSKLYLVGGTTQSSTGVVTYSNSSVYTQSGKLYATQMNATNGFYETSDARLKNFKDDIKVLDVVSEIPTKYFAWKKDEEVENVDPELHIGTSAQEIQKIYPDLVTENEEGELLVDYARLSVIALAAIKELKKEIDTLKSASVKYKF